MKIYLDNTIIGRLVDISRGTKPPEAKLVADMTILPDLVALCRKHHHILFISVEAEAEIIRVEKAVRRQELLDKLPEFELLPVAQNRQWVSLVDALEKFLLTKTRISRASKKEALRWDARHLATAKLNNCDVFLTTDYGSIWAYRRALKRLYRIDVRRPVEFYRELTVSETRKDGGQVW